MKLLALDSSGLVASIAILEDHEMVAEYTVNYKKTHSQTLLPMLNEISKMIELDLNSIDAIAVAAGPGSFTGLRIGSATAKGLGLALNKPIISVPTVDALAYNLFGVDKLICPIMDARRDQVYTGLYQWEDQELKTILHQRAISIDELIEEINLLKTDVIFLGDRVPVFKKVIEEKVCTHVTFAPAHVNRQRAGSIGTLGKKMFLDGKIEKAEDHAPDYLRVSQAEREKAEREAKK